MEYGFIPIVKVEKDEADPSVRYVWGCATNDQIDTDAQIVDAAFARKAMSEWYATGANVRQMHATSLPPAGKGVLLESRPDGEYVRTKVVEPVAVKLVDEGVYTGYSVGIAHPRIVRDARARGGRIESGTIVEISLVDRPANSQAKFAVLKMARGSLSFVGKSVTIPAVTLATPKRVRVPGIGARVTVVARDGDIERTHRGQIIAKGTGSLALDARGHGQDEIVRLLTDDIVSITKRGPIGRDHDFTHASDLTEGSVADATDKPGKQPDTQVDAAPPVDVDDASEAGPDGDADDAVTKAVGNCSKCKGSGFRSEGIKCAKCGGTGSVEKAAKGQKAPKAAKGAKVAKGVAVEQREGQFVVIKGEAVLGTHTDEAAAVAQKSAVIEAETAAKAAAKSQRRVEQIAAKATKVAKRADKRAEKKAKKAAKAEIAKAEGEVPWLLKRAHDFSCGAYDTDAVAAAYPTIEKGLGSVLGDSTRQSLHATLATEVGDTTTSNPAGVAALAKALAAITDILDDEHSAVDLLPAREVVRKSFGEVNPDAAAKPSSFPGQADSIHPGQFRRPYLADGHADKGGTGHGAATIPATTHPVRADQFERGPLTEGHQRYLASKLADLHDGLADWRPDLCLMAPMDADGSHAFDRQPAESFQRDPFNRRIPSGATNAPVAAVVPETRRAPGEKGTVPQIVIPQAGALAADVSNEAMEQALSKAMAPTLAKIASMQSTIDTLAAQPDLGQAAYRGVAAPGARKVATVGADPRKAARKAQRGKKADRVEFLQGLAATGDPSTRIRALDRLAKMGVTD